MDPRIARIQTERLAACRPRLRRSVRRTKSDFAAVLKDIHQQTEENSAVSIDLVAIWTMGRC